jgi:hypothetical protein
VLTAVHGTDAARTVTARIDDRRRRTERSGTDRTFAARVLAQTGHGRDVRFDVETTPSGCRSGSATGPAATVA